MYKIKHLYNKKGLGNFFSSPKKPKSYIVNADETGVCPIGWEQDECASDCPPTCEDYLEPKLKICTAVCAACECPRGMVVFRDRCVDPLECYTLTTGNLLLCGRITIELYYIYFNSAESIPINPLPQVSLISTVEPSIQYTPINRTYAVHPHFTL